MHQHLLFSGVVKSVFYKIQGITMKASLEIPNMLLNLAPQGLLASVDTW